MHRFSRRPLGFPRCFQALAGLALVFCGAAGAAEPLPVVASVKPVHSLVAGVMAGAGSPHLIVTGGASPHSYSLKPSDARALQQAKVVVWVGAGLESFLETALAALAGRAAVVELGALPGLTRLPYREGGVWETDDHDEDHDAAHGGAPDETSHGGAAVDQHLWLDPDNARVMVAAIAAALAKADPDNAGLYRGNAEDLARRLDDLTAEITAELAPVKERPFVVFHDAFQYLDTRFGLNTLGAITVDPDRQPGAARLKEIQAEIAQRGAVCVFAEPQFEPRLVRVVIEGSQARAGILDPLGADLADGPELYFELLRANAAALKACLGAAG